MDLAGGRDRGWGDLLLLVYACGSSDDPEFGSGSGGAANSGKSGSAGQAGSGGSPGSGGASSAGTGGATAAGSGGCVGASCGVGDPGSKPPNTPCSTPQECASGRCEPVTGTTDVVRLGACFADGAPCTRALDCCSTGCFVGRCGGLCTVEGEECSSNAECCSNLCQDGECQLDEANPDCRPTGEDCTSGTSRGCCHACDEATDRCGFPQGTCFAQGVACTEDAQCCRGQCLDGACRTPCTADGATCTSNAECCTGRCNAGSCAPPETDAGVCVPVGDACTSSADCCSNFCFGGLCDRIAIE